MKDLSLLIWLTQLGISVIGPLVGFVLLAAWLQNRFAWGAWVIWAGVILGVLSAVDGLRSSLRVLERLAKNRRKDEEPPGLAFNDHD